MGIREKKAVEILVVDDDKVVADTLVQWLSKKGYQATAAYGGREGINLFEQGDFKLVITDLVMPDMDGMEVLEAIKSIDKRATVLMVTGFGTIEKALMAMKKGAYDFISKPVDFKVLDVVINRALERHTLFRRLGVFRGLTLALIISVPMWLIIGIMLAMKFFK